MQIVASTDAFIGDLGKKTRRMNAEIQAAVTRAAQITGFEMQDVLSRWGSHPPNTKTPSPPGSTPAMISGFLRDSVTATPAMRTGFDTYTAGVGPTADYAAVQELGGGNNIPPRPYMDASRAMARRQVQRTIALAVERSFA